MKTAIIGAGVSGLAASIASKGDVVVFEKNNDALKKLLLTGSGRCNIKNINNNLSKYHSSNRELIKDIINESNLNMLDTFFNEIGLVLKNKNGYFYPFSEKSSSVLSCLKASSNAEFRYNTNVKSITKNGDKFMINDEAFDKVIITCGGLSYPKTGSTGDGYLLAKRFGHTIKMLNPSLMALCTNTGLEKKWAGIRCEVVVASYIDNSFIKKEHGELQLTSTGLSGICIFNLSRDIRLALNDKKNCEVSINFSPFDDHSLKEVLSNNKNISDILDGFLDYKLTNIILETVGISKDSKFNDLSIKLQDKLINALTNYKVKIEDTKDYLDAQVTCGGVSLDEIKLDTMESKLVKGLFLAGEVLDIDGDCGGYNLTAAFITGLIAGGSHDKN